MGRISTLAFWQQGQLGDRLEVEPQAQAWRFGIHDNGIGIGIEAEHLGQEPTELNLVNYREAWAGLNRLIRTAFKLIDAPH